MGAEESVDWKHFANAEEAITDLRNNGYKVYAIEQALNSHQLHLVDFKSDQKIAVIFGNEVTGVEQTTIEQCDGCIEIPQLGMKHSLKHSHRRRCGALGNCGEQGCKSAILKPITIHK